MRVYTVSQWANGTDAGAKGYGQWFEARTDDCPFCGYHGEARDYNGVEIHVNSRQVLANDGSAAIEKYRDWLYTGKGADYLTSDADLDHPLFITHGH